MWEVAVALLDQGSSALLVGLSICPRTCKSSCDKASLSIMVLSTAAPCCLHDGIVALTAHADDWGIEQILHREKNVGLSLNIRVEFGYEENNLLSGRKS